MSQLNFRPSVLRARALLQEGRERIAQQHHSGSPGIQTCAALTDVLDQIIITLFSSAIEEFDAALREELLTGVTIAALGGFGRADVAPFSDVDLLVLHKSNASNAANALAKRMIQDLYDAGLIAGQSLRTVKEACRSALQDATIFTTQLEARYLAGNETLFAKFIGQYRKYALRNRRKILKAIVDSRAKERQQFGETVYLLEPNVKRSPGGLRDLQLIRWIGYAAFGHKDPNSLHLAGELHADDRNALRSASEFLLQIRNELHFYAGKAHDVLDKGEQLRIAKLLGYEPEEGLLPVERFMREYFRHTQAVQQIVMRFIEGAQPYRKVVEWFGPLVSYSMTGEFHVGPHSITANRRGQASLRKDLSQVLRLTVLANLFNKRIAHSTWKFIRNSVEQFNGEVPASAREKFLELLDNPTRLGELLRTLNELGVLERIIPAFTRVKSLLQFNEYHKYTVDEHSFRAVECATQFFERKDTLGEAYRNLQDKRLLHLALLIHDLGKGFVEDHSEVGLRIAADLAEKFNLPEHDAETLKFLVHKHLAMSHLAFRRDTSDPEIILKFAMDVGSPDVLSMLFILTCADLSAVGPGVFNDWKCEVLSLLYKRTLRHLAGDSITTDDEQRRRELRILVAGCEPADWYQSQIDKLSSSYLNSAPTEQLAGELIRMIKTPSDEVKTWSKYLPESQTVEYTIATSESITSGIFHKLTGALSSQGLQILSADIHTLDNGLVLDRFKVTDPDFAGEPPVSRLEQINELLSQALQSDNPPTFRRLWRNADRKNLDSATRRPTQFRADNNTSQHFTILDIFAMDRMGLLYTISKTLYDLGLSVATAKIGTYIDQVVDVFYVTDRDGNKIEDEQLQAVRKRVMQAIDEAETADSTT